MSADGSEPCHAKKTQLEEAEVFIHEPEDATGATVVHVDIYHEVLSELLGGESTFAKGTDGGALIGLTSEQQDRAREIASDREP